MTAFDLTLSLVAFSFMGMIFFFVLTAVGIVFFQLFARLIGGPVARAIDGLVWASVREQAWGDDKQKEGVDGISSHPPLFPPRFAPLPKAMGDQIGAYCDKHAITTLQKIRALLGMSNSPQPSPDLRAQLSTTLNWRELIHTSYFDIQAFTRLMAYGLHRAGLGQLSNAEWTETSRAEAEGWLREISLPPAPSFAASETQGAPGAGALARGSDVAQRA